jgi:hypothetical protein
MVREIREQRAERESDASPVVSCPHFTTYARLRLSSTVSCRVYPRSTQLATRSLGSHSSRPCAVSPLARASSPDQSTPNARCSRRSCESSRVARVRSRACLHALLRAHSSQLGERVQRSGSKRVEPRPRARRPQLLHPPRARFDRARRALIPRVARIVLHGASRRVCVPAFGLCPRLVVDCVPAGAYLYARRAPFTTRRLSSCASSTPLSRSRRIFPHPPSLFTSFVFVSHFVPTYTCLWGGLSLVPSPSRRTDRPGAPAPQRARCPANPPPPCDLSPRFARRLSGSLAVSTLLGFLGSRAPRATLLPPEATRSFDA